MKIYTKTGDKGLTSLCDGSRVEKDHQRVDTYGDVDELSACLGLANSFILNKKLHQDFVSIQKDLMLLATMLATPATKTKKKTKPLSASRITFLEKRIDEMQKELPPLKNFILPGGATAAVFLHLTRTICRRAERKAVTLNKQEKINPVCLIYLNRLSDYFFVASRYVNYLYCEEDVVW